MCHFVEAGSIFGRLIDAIRKEKLDIYIHILTQNENEYLHVEPYMNLRRRTYAFPTEDGNKMSRSTLSTCPHFLSAIYK